MRIISGPFHTVFSFYFIYKQINEVTKKIFSDSGERIFAIRDRQKSVKRLFEEDKKSAAQDELVLDAP